jgi:hypothetical protein
MQVSRNINEICFSLIIRLSIVSQYVPIKLYKRYFLKNFKITYKIQSFHDHLDRERVGEREGGRESLPGLSVT